MIAVTLNTKTDDYVISLLPQYKTTINLAHHTDSDKQILNMICHNMIYKKKIHYVQKFCQLDTFIMYIMYRNGGFRMKMF